MAHEITGETSDGYHTFNELYEHRFTLWMALCRFIGNSWRSRLHSDGTFYEGWFVLGVGHAVGEQITYHLPLRLWDEAGFARTLPRVQGFDGHTSADVLKRISALVPSNDTRALEVEGAAVIAAFGETEFATSRARALLDWSRRALGALGVADLAYRNLFAQYTKGERTLEVAANLGTEDALVMAQRSCETRLARALAAEKSLEVAMGALEEVQRRWQTTDGRWCTLCDHCICTEDCPVSIASRALATLRSGVAEKERT